VNLQIAKLPSKPELPDVPLDPDDPLDPEDPLEPDVPLVPPEILAVKDEKAIWPDVPEVPPVKSVTIYSLSFEFADRTIGKSVILVFDITYKYFSILFFTLSIILFFMKEHHLMIEEPNCYHFELL
jgi:hypothetical protein